MKFNPDSEYEVKSGEPFDVNVPSGDIFVILTKAYLRDVSEEIDETIILHIIVDGKSFVAGTLHPQKRREQVLQIPIDKNFQISHTSTNGSVHFSAKNILKNIEYLACVCSVITSAESDADCDDDEKKETANKEEGPASEFAHRHFCKFYNKWFKTQALLSIAIVAVAIARYVRTK